MPKMATSIFSIFCFLFDDGVAFGGICDRIASIKTSPGHCTAGRTCVLVFNVFSMVIVAISTT